MAAPSEAFASRRDAILDAAYQAFARYGYRRTSMEEIARGTGMSRASLYLQFANKEEIFRALVERVHGEAVATSGHLFVRFVEKPQRWLLNVGDQILEE